MRGQYAFQTDILVSKTGTALVVIEAQVGTLPHDVVLYSAKAQTQSDLSVLAVWLSSLV